MLSKSALMFAVLNIVIGMLFGACGCSQQPIKPIQSKQLMQEVKQRKHLPDNWNIENSEIGAEIAQLEKEIEELERTYPAASALWPENVVHSIAHLEVVALENDQLEINLDQLDAFTASADRFMEGCEYRLERTQYELKISDKRIEKTSLKLQQFTGNHDPRHP